MSLKTFKLWLEPDPEIPRFQRLQWRLVDVPVADVLLHGIHPWAGDDRHRSLPEEFLHRMNTDEARIPALTPFNYCADAYCPDSHFSGNKTKFERLLEIMRDTIRFVVDLEYLELLEIARTRLAANWSHETAHAMMTDVFYGFQELRRFLKSKDDSIRLSSRDDVDLLDLKRLVSIDDFTNNDAVVIGHGIPVCNFRQTTFLNSVMDSEGRLRILPEIRNLSVIHTDRSGGSKNGPALTWYVTRTGHTLAFRPDIGDDARKREMAERFAARWRTDHGRLCFNTSIDRLAEMMERDLVRLDFPDLKYLYPGYVHSAHVAVVPSRIEIHQVGRFITKDASADLLKTILRIHGLSTSGVKKVLIDRLTELAATEYRKHLPELDAYFARNHFVRAETGTINSVPFPVLRETGDLHCLLLTMYAVRHLRGNAILEAAHVNDTYTEEELARALLNRDVTLSGSFLRVA